LGILYIVGARLRHLATREALKTAGRYRVVAENLRVKDVRHEGTRYIIYYCQRRFQTGSPAIVMPLGSLKSMAA